MSVQGESAEQNDSPLSEQADLLAENENLDGVVRPRHVFGMPQFISLNY